MIECLPSTAKSQGYISSMTKKQKKKRKEKSVKKKNKWSEPLKDNCCLNTGAL
jgi:hypothetical protein